ncbi:hypothetical protein CFPU101_16680 [Chroococcus sp. FPU101]|nr:hypothetical protein CFPU101_16680 [Chroococcus sp. FPU101]
MDNSQTSDEPIIRLMEQHPTFAPVIRLARDFADLIRQRKPEKFDLWLERAIQSQIRPFQRFAEGLKEDYQAVKFAMTLNVSNGQVEGQINRLKMLKRQMYGRAGLDLLSRRFLLAN